MMVSGLSFLDYLFYNLWFLLCANIDFKLSSGSSNSYVLLFLKRLRLLLLSSETYFFASLKLSACLVLSSFKLPIARASLLLSKLIGSLSFFFCCFLSFPVSSSNFNSLVLWFSFCLNKKLLSDRFILGPLFATPGELF